MEVFEDLKTTLQKNIYISPFDFDKFGINERDKAEIIAREEIIVDNAKKYAKSLYEICKAVYDVRVILKSKDNDISFTEWYKSHGLNKDKVSELIKRYELYIQAPDKIDFITNLSIPAVKELTRKSVNIDSQILAIEYGLKDAKEIKSFLNGGHIAEKAERFEKNLENKEIDIFTDAIEDIEVVEMEDDEDEIKLWNDNVLIKLDAATKILVNCHYDNFSQLAKSPSRLSKYKSNIQALQKFLKQVSDEIENEIENNTLKNNLKLVE